jgi:hypothetical protein
MIELDVAIVELHPDRILHCSGVGPEPALLGFRATSDLTALDANCDPVRKAPSNPSSTPSLNALHFH